MSVERTRRLTQIPSQGLAGIVPAFANAAYMPNELAHAFKVSHSSHMAVSPASLPIAIRALEVVGFTEADAKRRIIIMARRRETPQEILRAGWKTLDDLLSEKRVLLPERFDGRDTQETAEIYFSSGKPSGWCAAPVR